MRKQCWIKVKKLTEEAQNLIVEALKDISILNLPKGRILYIPYDATDEQIEKAILFFDNEFKRGTARIESDENIYLEVNFDETQN